MNHISSLIYIQFRWYLDETLELLLEPVKTFGAAGMELVFFTCEKKLIWVVRSRMLQIECLNPPKIHMLKPYPPNVMVFGGGAFGK